MKDIFKRFLFNKHILVHYVNYGKENSFETAFALANFFNIRITRGQELAERYMIHFASEMLGVDIPEPFYRGFPSSVRQLSRDQLIYDQMLHYFRTYGSGNFTEAGYSVFEEKFERAAFKENCEIKEFEIVDEAEAVKLLKQAADDMLMGSRPLNEMQLEFLVEMRREYDHKIDRCASKNTAIRLLIALRDVDIARFISLSDVIKLVDELLVSDYYFNDTRKLNLRNKDRKFIEKILDNKLSDKRCRWRDCYEKKALWSGLLHHIHYKAKSENGKLFVESMRGDENRSVYSVFEAAMAAGDIRRAIDLLKEGKGSGALLRNLEYIISRIEDPSDLTYLLNESATDNTIILLQLQQKYAAAKRPGVSREFTFVRNNLIRTHKESDREIKKRRSVISEGQAKTVKAYVDEKLDKLLRGRLGRVYVDTLMKNYALPLQESSGRSGYGVLAKGSRLKIEDGKKIRAFTYWEKVDDIDLSVIGLKEDGSAMEFSWRTMASKQSDAIVFSGDETSGYAGGSEYFDIDVEMFRIEYPDIRYLIFCDNVYSNVTFDRCMCKAGYMLRDLFDSGEIYEPKTVQTSFLVNGKSIFAYLFGIDLKEREFMWLNLSSSRRTIVAGDTSMSFLLDYFKITDTMNVYRFFELMAQELVEDPEQAELIVSDRIKLAEGDKRKVIHSYDHEKLITLMEGRIE